MVGSTQAKSDGSAWTGFKGPCGDTDASGDLSAGDTPYVIGTNDPNLNADAFVTGSQSLSTPTFVVNGKYRLNAESAGNYDNVIEVVKFLVAKETPGAAK